MKETVLLIAALSAVVQLADAATPTSYIDIHLVTSFSSGSMNSGYQFRVEASESSFAGSPPKGPQWSTHSALTGGAGGHLPDYVQHKTSNRESGYPSFRLMLPPSADKFLCNESDGDANYKNPTGNSGVFDPDTLLSGFEGSYMLVPRGGCTFEAKARSAQRLGASGVILRNTLDSRYGLEDEDAETRNRSGGPDWSNTKWPVEQRDFECGTNKASGNIGWRAEIETSELDFDPAPYDGKNNNKQLTGPAVEGNLCAKQPNLNSFEKHCPSERCLLTGRNASDDGSILEACCAWDLFIRMGTDGANDGDAIPQEDEEKITIPALFVTMENGDELYEMASDADANSSGSSVQFISVVPYRRWYPPVHWSGVVLWALSVFTVWISSFESANEYRTSWKKISKAVADGVLVFQRSATNSNAAAGRERAETEDTVELNEDVMDLELTPEVEMTEQNGGAAGVNGQNEVPTIDNEFSISDDAANEDDFVGNPAGGSTPETDGHSFSPAGGPPPAADLPNGSATAVQEPQRVNLQSRSTTATTQNMDLNAFHAVFIIVFAVAFLFVLFFFNLDKVVRVLYGLAGSLAMTVIMFNPLYSKVVSSKYLGEGLSKKLQSNAFGCRGTNYTWIDIASASSGLILGIAWICVGLTRVRPMTNVYYWLIQDVMGVCLTILILGLIHINTIMVATILLCLVFIYDLFYVLISPYFFGTGGSVMVNGSVDPGYCEKYPSDSACRGSLAPMPMILAIPFFGDFRGGFSMIGLGEIILPGLLISFAARYDAARELVRKCSQTSSIRSGENGVDAGTPSDESGGSTSRSHYHLGRVYKAVFKGYFGPLVISYAVGLMAAFIAVWMMRRSQPALLYLVPACLGTMLFLGWGRRELSDLWSGPKIMKKANRMVAVSAKIPEARASAARNASGSLAETSSVV